MNRVRSTVFVSLVLSCALAYAQQDVHPAAPPSGAVAHGVSSQYEKPDSFPVYDVHPVDVSNKAPFYSPDVLTIHVGDLVRWNNSQLSDTHTVIEHDGHFNSSEIKQGEQWCYHFVAEGDYSYSCRFHPWMKGVIHVKRRDLELHPADDAAMSLASFRTSHPEAPIDAHGDVWLAGSTAGTLQRIDGANGPTRLVHVEGISTPMHPLAANDSHVFVQAGARVAAIDLPAAGVATAKVADWIDLPVGMTHLAARGAADGTSLWLISADRKTLLSIDLKTKAVHTRVFDPKSTLSVVLVSEPGHALILDSARSVLLKAGPEWTTEIALAKEPTPADEMVADGDGAVWIKSHDQPTVTLVRTDGSVELFHIPGEQQVHLIGGRGNVMIAGLQMKASIVSPPGSSIVANSTSGSSCSKVGVSWLPTSGDASTIVISKGEK